MAPPFTEPEPQNAGYFPAHADSTRRPSEPTIDSTPRLNVGPGGLPPGAAPPARHGSDPHVDSRASSVSMPIVSTSRSNSQMQSINELPRYPSGEAGHGLTMVGEKGDEKLVAEPLPMPVGMRESMEPQPANTMMVPGQHQQQHQMPYQPYQSQHQMSLQSQAAQQPLPPTPAPTGLGHWQQQMMTPPIAGQMYQQSPPMTPGGHHAMPPPPTMPSHQSSQPGPTQNMTFNPKNARNLPTNGRGEREWGISLFDCSNVGLCFMSWCCPCMVYAQIGSRMSYLERNGRPHPSGGDMVNSDCMIHGCLTGCCALGWVLQIGQRSNVRDRYRIEGDGCMDCMCSWCCTPCALSQESLEIEIEERAINGAAAANLYNPADGKIQ